MLVLNDNDDYNKARNRFVEIRFGAVGSNKEIINVCCFIIIYMFHSLLLNHIPLFQVWHTWKLRNILNDKKLFFAMDVIDTWYL